MNDNNHDDWKGPTGMPGSLERLCSISLRACQLMNPLISAIYEQLISSNKNDLTTVKADNSAFTIADGLVQRLLIDELFAHINFRDIVGEEEDEEKYHDKLIDGGDTEWRLVQGLTIPDEIRPVVDSTRAEIRSLAAEYLSPKSNEKSNRKYQQLTAFIDPIDGTREFSKGKGEQCSVCIGFANEHGRAAGGVVYRPLSQPKPTWVAGAKSEGYAECNFDTDAGNIRGGLLTTNGSISPFLESLIDELQMVRVKSGGAGNKMMMLLENENMLYIQDRGVSRWDTCAAEACLESFGGQLTKMSHLLEADDAMEPNEFYTYLASQSNLDFIPGSAKLTKYNCRTSTKELQPNEKVIDVDQVKPYSNLCGLVALGKELNTVDGRMQIQNAIQRAATKNPPSFD